MNRSFEDSLLRELEATQLVELETLQELWSGYGTIKRYRAEGSSVGSIIVKHVRPPTTTRHPRGWDGERSHQRKLKSYEVESAWYREWAPRCDASSRVPRCHALETDGHEFWIALEDLDAAGYPVRRSSATLSEIERCICWLAAFHATFMGDTPDGLWEIGTYWHLDTRPDELERIADQRLKKAAGPIDRMLRGARFQTLVHGDAKLANFCFPSDGQGVAAVDFQYVGGGCGMKDLAYLLGSCLDAEACEDLERSLLDLYFGALRDALTARRTTLDLDALETEWRALHAPAWADFHRFLMGWSPGHWKLNRYENALTQRVLDALEGAAGR